MSKILIPGSFDPMTIGHEEIIKRCSTMFDTVVVMVGYNEAKKGLLSVDERILYAKDALKDYDNVVVESYNGLVVDFAHDNGIDFIVKGIRNEKDLAYESEMAYVNSNISFEKYGKRIETFLMNSSPEYAYTSSSLVRSLLGMNLSVDKYVHNPELLLLIIGKHH